MLLPNNVLKLISEYSKPLSRPDWRTFIRKINTVYFIQSLEKYNVKNVFILAKQNMNMSHFYTAYHHIYYFGIKDYIVLYKEDINVILSNKWLYNRNESYKNYEFMYLYSVKNYR
jgi:hypothetical protein